jgi:hypothetical protein
LSKPDHQNLAGAKFFRSSALFILSHVDIQLDCPHPKSIACLERFLRFKHLWRDIRQICHGIIPFSFLRSAQSLP